MSQDDILQFDVSMYDTVSVQEIDPFYHFSYDYRGCFFTEFAIFF